MPPQAPQPSQPPPQVLRFYCCWAQGGSGGGGAPGLQAGPLPYVLHYFLADDCVEVREVHPRNDGRDPFPMLLSKRRLPKTLPPVGECAPGAAQLACGVVRCPACRPAVRARSLPSRPAARQPQALGVQCHTHTPPPAAAGARPPSACSRAEQQPEHYHWSELRIGAAVHVYGRQLLLLDCDDSTRAWYLQQGGLSEEQLAPLDVELDQAPRPPVPQVRGAPSWLPPPGGQAAQGQAGPLVAAAASAAAADLPPPPPPPRRSPPAGWAWAARRTARRACFAWCRARCWRTAGAGWRRRGWCCASARGCCCRPTTRSTCRATRSAGGPAGRAAWQAAPGPARSPPRGQGRLPRPPVAEAPARLPLVCPQVRADVLP
jgi:hypothetical protein